MDSYEERICRIRHTVKEKVFEHWFRVRYIVLETSSRDEERYREERYRGEVPDAYLALTI